MSELENKTTEINETELNAEDMEEVSGGAFRVPPAKEGFMIYQVQYGENLTRIAQKFNTTVNKILKDNPRIKDKNLIRTGSYLYIRM